MAKETFGDSTLNHLLKKAVSLGAGAYVSAENTVAKTLNTIQLPKEVIREAIEGFFESYTITVNAEIKFKPKAKKEMENE